MGRSCPYERDKASAYRPFYRRLNLRHPQVGKAFTRRKDAEKLSLDLLSGETMVGKSLDSSRAEEEEGNKQVLS